MNDKENTPTKEPESIEYKVDKITFHVLPVYRENSDQTIHHLILNLMKEDRETH